jgi:hypothetical protein
MNNYPIAYYYTLELIYGVQVNQGHPEHALPIFQFEIEAGRVYIPAPDEFIARIALLDLGYGIIK